MESAILWELFMQTGAPEMYMLYNKAKKTEEAHVPNDTGTCSASHQL